MFNSIRKTLRITGALGRRLAQDPFEALLIFRLAWWVAVMSVAARYCSLPRALQLVSTRTSTRTSEFGTTEQEQLARSLDLVLSADVLMFRPICWKRAAVLHRFLAMKGITTRICFGVKPGSEDKVTGHAWLEADGKPILEKEPPEYVVTYSFPSNSSFADSALAFPVNW